MKIELILNNRNVRNLINNLGENRVTVLSTDGEGYQHVAFEVNGMMDVLSVLHAGQDSGIEIATGKKVSVTVA